MKSVLFGAVSIALACVSCNDKSSGAGGSKATSTGTASTGTSGNAQTPPEGMASVEAWIATGQYKQWNCEPMVHASRPPSPHGFNRICSNMLIHANAAGTGNWPAGAAAVKELYASATDTKPVGYAVYLKTAADSAGGNNWYWYERVPLDSMAPHDSKGIVADGLGATGPANTICVGCHVAAGTDAGHTPSPGGRDFVYTPE